MGADGGYRYIYEADLKRLLSEKDVALFVKFLRRIQGRSAYKEDVDVKGFEETLKGPYLRYPVGTDISASHSKWRENEYTNPPEEVWYYNEFCEEHDWERYRYWWSSPAAWYVFGYQDVKDQDGWYLPLVTVPTPEELEDLVRIMELVEHHCPTQYLETWT